MGDSKRFSIVAEFIFKNFPPSKYPKVADVAGGMGYLSLALKEKGYTPTIIDPRKSNLHKKDRKKTKHRKPFERMVKNYTPELAQNFDLIIGLHPDGATEALARTINKPVVIIPCCNYWSGPEKHGTSSVPLMIELAGKKK